MSGILGADGFGVWAIQPSDKNTGGGMRLILSGKLRSPEEAASQEWEHFLSRGMVESAKRKVPFLARWRSHSPFYVFVYFSSGVAVFSGSESIWEKFQSHQAEVVACLSLTTRQPERGRDLSLFATALFKARTLEMTARVCADFFFHELKASRVSIFCRQGKKWDLLAVSGSLKIDGNSAAARDILEGFRLALAGQPRHDTLGDKLSCWSMESSAERFGIFIENASNQVPLSEGFSTPVGLAVHALHSRTPLFRKAMHSALGGESGTPTDFLKSMAFLVGFIALVLFLIRPVPQVVSGPCELVPTARADVVVETPGRVVDLLAREGSVVEKGQPLLRLDDSELVSNFKITGQKLAKATAESRHWQELGDMKSFRASDIDRQRLEMESEELQKEINLSTVRAPLGGVVLTKDLELLRGEVVPAGKILAEVASMENWDLQIRIEESDAGIIERALRSGHSLPVRYVLQSQADVTLHGVVSDPSQISQMVYPDANYNFLYVTIRNIELPHELLGSMRAGFSGYAKIDGPKVPFLWGALQKIGLFLRMRVFL